MDVSSSRFASKPVIAISASGPQFTTRTLFFSVVNSQSECSMLKVSSLKSNGLHDGLREPSAYANPMVTFTGQSVNAGFAFISNPSLRVSTLNTGG